MSDGRNLRVNLPRSGIAINYIIRSIFTPDVYKLYQCAMPFTAESKNLLLIIQNLQFLEINILGQDLIVILRNITRLCQVRQRGVGEGG